MLPFIVVLWAITSFGRLASAAEVQCWAPDGITLADNDTVVPCNKLGIQQDGVYSSCCRLDGDPKQRDYCTTSGLCLSTLDNVLRREFCTDKTWKSPACVNVCTDTKNRGSNNDSVVMTQCPDGTYCCGQNELGCCGTDRAIDIPTQGSVVSSGAHNTSSNTSNAFKNATISLAVALGVVAIFAAGVIAWLFHQNKAMKKQLLEKGEEASHLPPPVVVHPYSSTYEPATPQMKDPSMPESPSMASGVLVGRRHFSELDGSMSATRSEMGSPVQHDYFNGEASPRSFHSHSATAHVGPSQ